MADWPNRPPAGQCLGRAEDHGVGTVGQMQDDESGSGRRARGGHRLQCAGQDEERVGRATLAHAPNEVVDHHRLTQAQLLDQAGDGAAVHAGHHEAPDVAGLDAG